MSILSSEQAKYDSVIDMSWLKIKDICDGYRSWEDLDYFKSILVSAYSFSMEVNNGGVRQYLENSSGDYFYEVNEFVSLLDYPDGGCLMKSIMGEFPDAKISADRIIRCELIEEMAITNSHIFDIETDIYYRIEDEFCERISRFVEENRDCF